MTRRPTTSFSTKTYSSEVFLVNTMTTKELAEYLRVHETTICKHAAAGRIPGKRLDRVWNFEKTAIDKWIRAGGQNAPSAGKRSNAKSTRHILRKRSSKKGRNNLS
jgi:excisionase family DNA binding protein